MKQISPELKERIKKEPASPELVLALLKESSPKDFCVREYFKGESSNPEQCCILGRISYEIHGNAYGILTAQQFAYRKIIVKEPMDIAAVNNGQHPSYKQKSIFARLRAAMRDVIKENKKQKP